MDSDNSLPRSKVEDVGDGKVKIIFEDETFTQTETHHIKSREMIVEGRTFQVNSLFSKEAKSTPTEKMLRYIDLTYNK